MRNFNLKRSLARFVQRDDGATLLEYALIAALASVIVIIAVLALVGNRT
ncbi:Flp family type IVb pilin [Duganella sp. FT80W]|uniref:Flp family type IVb pilin n=1 Tax=Duganella guangzhouensis TaxID=2666084 RepID=A0A6I2L9U0_9BURK|nr:Flp family type IVb pilin [Duganella guangzhouensis]MRW94613.1 Flp family type IVb pilin [Duganella guangzhouensis]